MPLTMQGLFATGVLAAAAAQSLAAQGVYQGICDASAAIALGKGHFIVADDESDVLQVYKRGTAMPVGTADLAGFLHNRKPNGKTDEADIEGAALIGQRIYWISSHALSAKKAEVDPHRRRFFATDIVTAATDPAPGVKPVGKPYETLLDELLRDKRFALLAKAIRHIPEDKHGLNIEGLAATPEGALLIGFRNPRPKGRALVIALLNPGEVIDAGAKPRFGDLMRIDLGGRGIRSMERVGSELLIVAGPHGEASKSKVQPPFALFRWSGDAARPAGLVRALSAGSFRPEAMFLDGEQRELVLLSDDGDEPAEGGGRCKDKDVPKDRKRFRAMAIPWP